MKVLKTKLYFIFKFTPHNQYLFDLLFYGSQKKTHTDQTEAGTRGVLCKQVFLEIWQKSQENTCATSRRPATLLKRDSGKGVFLCQIFENTFVTEHLWAIAPNQSIPRSVTLSEKKRLANLQKYSNSKKPSL